MNDNELVPVGDNRGRSDLSLPGLRGALGIVVANTIEALRPLIDNMFDNIDDYFIDRAEQADLSFHHTMYLDAMRYVRGHRVTISDDFFAAITNSALAAWGERPSAKRVPGGVTRRFNIDDITVLTDDEMELAAAGSGIVNKGNVRYGYELGCLTRTLNSISRRAPVEERSNPVGTSSITRSFTGAIGRLSLDVQILLCLLKIFERDVADVLGGVYASALQQLENSGVSIVNYAVDERTVSDHGLNRDDVGVRSYGTVEFDELQRCLSASMSGTEREAFGSHDDTRPVSNAGQLLHALSAAQGQFLEQFSQSNPGSQHSLPSLQSFLLDMPEGQGGFENAGKIERDTLQLVSDLFENMLRNENMSLASKALIARLQLPVLKVALMDKSLFSDPDHPARKLLNHLAIDGIGWPTSAVLLDRNPLYLAGEDLVRLINDEFTDDIEIFQRLLDEWSYLVARKRSRTEGVERRVNETALGRAKLDAAKTIVQKMVNKRAAGSRLPTAVASFITHEWTKPLLVTCIKFGTSSDQWRMVCGAFDDLLSACQPVGNMEEVEPRRASISSLMSHLREGMEDSGSKEMGSLANVRTALEEILSSVSGDSESQVESLEVMEEITITDIRGEDTDATNEPQLSNLEPGCWIEIDKPNLSGPLRCRLIVFIDQTQTYVFANGDGVRVCEMSVKEMAQGLASGEFRFVHEELVVERAIDEMMARLQSTM